MVARWGSRQVSCQPRLQKSCSRTESQECARSLTARDRQHRDPQFRDDTESLHSKTEAKTETSTGLETEPDTLGDNLAEFALLKVHSRILLLLVNFTPNNIDLVF